MNFRCCLRSLLAVCVCLSVVFLNSHTAYASETTSYNDGDIYFSSDVTVYGNTVTVSSPQLFYRGQSITHRYHTFNMLWVDGASVKFTNRYTFAKADAKYFFREGSKVTIDLNGLSSGVSVSGYGDFILSNGTSNTYSVYLKKSDNTYISVNPSSVNFGYSITGMHSLSIEIDNVPCDTYAIIVDMQYSPSIAFATPGGAPFGSNLNGELYSTISSDAKISISEEPKSETNGLLNGIIGWLTSIRDNIVNLPSTIASSISGFFTNVVNAVSDLPNALKGFFDNIVSSITSMVSALKDKLSEVINGITSKLQVVLDGIKNGLTTLGNFIIDGIKGLFVPNEEDIANMKEDWETLLATRFGALYEVVQLCIDYANSFNSAASVSLVSGGGSTITIPTVSVPLGDVTFDFGGWEVDVVPKGFEFFIDSIKLMFSVCATVLFVNGLRNKFDKVVSK